MDKRKRATVTLKLDGKPLLVDHSWVPRAVKVLGRMPSDSFFSLRELAKKLGISPETVCHGAQRLKQWRLRVGSKYYYGSQSGIAALRRELEAQRNSGTAE
jgi:hypothetical protein